MHFNFILNEINKKKNWFAKIIFFDMYFDLVSPKCEIEQKLTNIDINIKSDISTLKKSLDDLQNKNKILEQKMSDMYNFLKRNFLMINSFLNL